MESSQILLDDKKIIELSKTNPDIFGEIVKRYYDRLFFYIRKISYFEKEDTEDILQNSFIKAYRFLNDYDDRMAFSTWIYRIARNAAFDEIRKKKSRPQTVHLENDEIAKMMRSSMDPQKELIASESLEKIKDIIYKMPYHYQEVLVLRYLEENDFNEIMDILEKPKGTIASLISRGREILIEEARKEKLV
jgi:RNA polymerase sigma-70 factor, ECF subfamily